LKEAFLVSNNKNTIQRAVINKQPPNSRKFFRVNPIPRKSPPPGDLLLKKNPANIRPSIDNKPK
jgi:hypothetical protein